MLDIYTGKPIRSYEPLTNAANAVLPMFKSNGGMEPWRQWMLSTGWDGLQKARINKYTTEPLTAEDRHYINNYIAKNADLQTQVMALMTKNDGFYQKKMKEYHTARGGQSQKDYPVKHWIVHRELDKIHDRAFKAAWNALEREKEQYTPVGREIKTRNLYLKKGQSEKALKKQKRVKELLNY